MKLKLQYFSHLMQKLIHLKRPWCWERSKVGGEGDDRGWDGWMASPTRWTWIWVSSGSWWWTGRPGILQSMGSQKVGLDWATEPSWIGVSSKSSNNMIKSWYIGLYENQELASPKDKIKTDKKQNIEWNKIFLTDLHEDFIICKNKQTNKLLPINKKRETMQFLNWVTHLNRHFIKEIIQIINSHIKGFLGMIVQRSTN